MNYFDINMALLTKREPRLAKRLETVSPAKDVDFASLSTSIIDTNIKLNHINTLVVLGFGVGTHVRELVERIPIKTFLLVIDPDIETFKALLPKIDLIPILKSSNVKLAIGEDASYAVRYQMDDYYKVNTIPDIVVAEHKPSVAKNPDYYKKVKELLEESSIVARQNLATLMSNASLWQEQILTNLPIIIKCPAIKTLFGKFPNIPVIIVSAGPSLDKNVAYLKYAKDKALIMCVDTALRTLFNREIKPDIVVTIDASTKNYNYYLKDLDVSDMYLVSGPAVYPETITSFAPNVFVSGFGHPLLTWIEAFIGKRGDIKLGGSVSTAAFDLARRCGCNPIIFIGQDLAFTDDKVYTSGVKQERIKEIEELMPTADIIWVEDVFGGQVKTVRGAWTWIKWFEYQISEMPDVLCIDATEGGAKIEGTKIMTLKETIEEYCQKTFNFKQTINYASKFNILPNLTSLLREMEVLIKDWKKVQFISKEGVMLTNKLLEIISNNNQIDKRTNKILKEIGILYQRIIENHKGLLKLGSWNLESLLYRMEKYNLSTDLNVRIKGCKIFFEEILTYCQESVLGLQSTRDKLLQIELERR
ncbi:MAG: 6-hydroxymethylpterin diphosphokinase MptE-like protein [Nitrospirota bacterium]